MALIVIHCDQNSIIVYTYSYHNLVMIKKAAK